MQKIQKAISTTEFKEALAETFVATNHHKSLLATFYGDPSINSYAYEYKVGEPVVLNINQSMSADKLEYTKLIDYISSQLMITHGLLFGESSDESSEKPKSKSSSWKSYISPHITAPKKQLKVYNEPGEYHKYHKGLCDCAYRIVAKQYGFTFKEVDYWVQANDSGVTFKELADILKEIPVPHSLIYSEQRKKDEALLIEKLSAAIHKAIRRREIQNTNNYYVPLKPLDKFYINVSVGKTSPWEFKIE